MYFFKKRSKLFQERFFLLKHSLDETLAFHVETDQHKRTDGFQVAKEVYFRENPKQKQTMTWGSPILGKHHLKRGFTSSSGIIIQ